MKTINYLLFGKPASSADCLDYMQDHRLVVVRMHLKAYDMLSENASVRRLSGFFVWNFEDYVACYEESFGGVYYADTTNRRLKSLVHANRRLAERLQELGVLNVDVSTDAAHFNSELARLDTAAAPDTRKHNHSG